MQRTVAYIALANALGPRSARLKPLLAHFKTPEAVLAANEAELAQVTPGIGRGTLAAIAAAQTRKDAERIYRYCMREGIAVLTPEDPLYPAVLYAIAEPPAVLYCRGKLPLPQSVPYVGMVGSRRADAYGAQMAYKLSFELAAAGGVVVSGMADGIDGICAAGALDAGGFTVAVLGCGIDIAYPKHHKRLMADIAQQGVVITEFAPGTRPNAWNFPMRNRIISALSEAVVVVEADEKSGALITAKYALLQGKSLFAVPGDVTSPRSAGCNRLLRAGALLALTAEDVLSHFRFLYRANITVPPEALQYTEVTAEKLAAHGVRLDGEGKNRGKSRRQSAAEEGEEQGASACEEVSTDAVASLDARQRELLSLLPQDSFTVDLLVAKGIPVGEAVAAMTLFEILGLVSSYPGGFYVKK